MKQCLTCQTTYRDDSIDFCLNDGTRLTAYAETAPPTQLLSFDREPVRINIPPSDPTIVSSKIIDHSHSAAPKRDKLVVVGALLIVMLLFVIGVFGYYFIFIKNNSDTTAKNTAAEKMSATPANLSPSATPDETAELKEKLDKLEKQLAEQQKKTARQNGLTIPAPSIVQKENLRSATVNSPNDGYLALRSEPNSKTGLQLVKIPHGAQVTVGNCATVARADGKTGKWCQVVYDGQAGWAFDGFLIY